MRRNEMKSNHVRTVKTSLVVEIFGENGHTAIWIWPIRLYEYSGFSGNTEANDENLQNMFLQYYIHSDDKTYWMECGERFEPATCITIPYSTKETFPEDLFGTLQNFNRKL